MQYRSTCSGGPSSSAAAARARPPGTRGRMTPSASCMLSQRSRHRCRPPLVHTARLPRHPLWSRLRQRPRDRQLSSPSPARCTVRFSAASTRPHTTPAPGAPPPRRDLTARVAQAPPLAQWLRPRRNHLRLLLRLWRFPRRPPQQPMSIFPPRRRPCLRPLGARLAPRRRQVSRRRASSSSSGTTLRGRGPCPTTGPTHTVTCRTTPSRKIAGRRTPCT